MSEPIETVTTDTEREKTRDVLVGLLLLADQAEREEHERRACVREETTRAH